MKPIHVKGYHIMIIKSHKNGALVSNLESSYGSGHSLCLSGKGTMVD
jgi:hypothetical protein